jgi:hypothetical protein
LLAHLFGDAPTTEDFKDFAFTRNYRQKMMLIINKMSNEAGSREERIKAYRKSIASALRPYDTGDLVIEYIDALDYIDGIEEGNSKLVQLSGFEHFIESLNRFVKDKAPLARLDTPVRILLGYLNDAALKLFRNDAEENAYLELLNRLSKVVDSERGKLRNQILNISLELSSRVTDLGVTLAQHVGKDEKEFQALCRQVEKQIQASSEESSQFMEQAVNGAIESLRKEVGMVVNSPLAKSFIAHVDALSTIDAQSVSRDESLSRARGNLATVRDIADQVGVGIVENAVGGKARLAGQSGGGFLKTTQVAGSNLHKGVYEVGKFIGFKFKPWEAVKLAKDIANVAKVVGPILSGLSLGLEIWEAGQEAEREQNVADARRGITAEFNSMARNLECEFQRELHNAEEQLFVVIEKSIGDARDSEMQVISEANKDIGRIREISKTLERLLVQIRKTVEVEKIPA